MNVTLHRTLMVCVLAGVFALAVALMAARDASAAPPEPVDDTFTIEEGVCDFPVLAEVSGKTKIIELPGEAFIATSPGVRITLTNQDQPTHQLTYVITGALHATELGSGDLLLVVTGRNLLFDPSFGMLLTIGRFTQVFDEQTETLTPPQGKGRVIDVCDRLA
jgi:hypothetical protein